jgi:hypothetical protein
MKKVTAFVSSSFVFVVSAAAFADAPAPSASGPKPVVPPPPFSALPSATTTTPPKEKAPARIPKTEKVDGFFVGDPPKNQHHEGKITNVIVFAKEEQAKDYSAGKWWGSSPGQDDTTCFSQPPRFRRDDSPAADWGSEIEPNAHIQAPMKPPPPPKKGEKPKSFTMQYGEMEVTAMHQEKFVLQEDKKARLEIVDAWVDPVTHGVRLIGRATVPLERIGSAHHGVKLYAAKGDKVVHVVARRDRPKEMNVDQPSKQAEFRMMNAMRQQMVVHNAAGEQDSTQCGFGHVTLKAQQGAAETAMFETNTVFLDPPEPKSDKEKADEDMFGFGSFGRPQDNGPGIRVRPFRATVSSTWSSRDTSPVISVSFGWAGRERDM